MSITSWPEAERPREKLLERGAAALSDAELLAIFLRVGVRGKSAVDLARELLTAFGGLVPLLTASPAEIARHRGVGMAKAAQLAAATELARRALLAKAKEISPFESPQAAKEWLQLAIGGLPHECFYVLLLDQRHRLIRHEPLFRGTTAETTVYPREVAKLALQSNASAVIVAHNHPSGHPEPSQSDLALTEQLSQALALIDVRLLDHFLVTQSTVCSFVEAGWWSPPPAR